MFGIQLKRTQVETVYIVDDIVEDWVVNHDGALGHLIGPNTVEYPAASTGRNGEETVYMVIGDVWFNCRPARQSDRNLYVEDLWIKAAATAAHNAVATAV